MSNPGKKLMDQYRSEFEEEYDELRKYALDVNENVQQRLQQLNANLQNVQPQLIQQGDEVLKSLQNMEPIPSTAYEKLLQTFAWTGVLQVGVFVAAILSGYIFHPLVGLTLGSFWSFMAAFVLLPVLAYLHVVSGGDDDRTLRFKLLGFALAEGALTGYLYSHRYLSSIQPLAFLTPFIVAGMAQQVPNFLGESASRVNMLGACAGSGLIAHLLIALPLGQLSFSYLLLSLLYSGVAFVAIQLYVKYSSEGAVANLNHLTMLGYVVGALVCQALVFFLFGGAKELEE